jgi:catechol 2,3-dioxygenase-like lactoylglutathione lyase family enzyme
MTHLDLVALVVREYDPAIRFFVDTLGFLLAEDVPSTTSDGRPKRWVVLRPPGGGTGLLLARADGDAQAAVVGRQFAGRVGLFVRVEDFSAAHARMTGAGVTFVSPPRVEPYGQVAVFLDLEGNRWDLLGPRPASPATAHELPVACTLTPGELQDRREGLLPGLLAAATSRTVIAGGYRYEFATAPGLLVRIAEVVERERQCCRFLTFVIDAGADLGPITVEVTGPVGTPAFLDDLGG